MKTIVKFFRFLWRSLDVLRRGLHLIVLLLVFGVLIVLVSPRVPVVPEKAALVVAPQGALVEQLSGQPFERAVAEAYGRGTAETLVRDLVDSIEAAQKDRRIQVLVLDLGSMAGGGVAKLEEVAMAVRKFRAAGKKVIAVGEAYDQSQYYLAANADEIYLDPQGMVLIEGFGYYRTFLKGAIDKLGIDINIFKAGKYKSFTDQFSRSEMSEQEREETGAWLNALWAQYQAGVTKARKLDPGAIDAYVNDMGNAASAKGGDLAAVALERGLVTEIKSRHEVDEQLKATVGEDEDEHTFRGISHWDYLAAVHREKVLKSSGNRIGVVVAAGEILDGDQPPGTIGSDSAVQLLRQARYDDDIKAVVLRIDSPGGSMQASEIIRREINALREAGKPIVASMSSTAASGGYYIAMDTDEIWASPSTLTGSIGVFGVFPTFENTLKKVGVTVDGMGTAPLSGSFQLERTMSDQAKQILQLYVENSYNTFIGHVAAAREKSVDEIDSIAQGRVWAGTDAMKHGLVDNLGSFRDALQAAARRAKLGDDFKVEYIEPPLGWREALTRQTQVLAGRITRALMSKHELSIHAQRLISPIETELSRMARFMNPMQAYYYCLCTVN